MKPWSPALSILVLAVLAPDRSAQCSPEKLFPTDGEYQDRFGASVSVSGNRALVGAPYSDFSTGAVHVLELQGDQWVETARLIASFAQKGDRFGEAVSLCGDRAMVGAPGDDGDAGSVLVFELQSGAWVEVAKIASPLASGSGFGSSVSLDGETVVVGAPDWGYWEHHPVYPSDWVEEGYVSVFKRQTQYWWAGFKHFSNPTPGNEDFGRAVCVEGDTVLVGAPGYQASAHVYDLEAWWAPARLTGSYAGSQFGSSVSLSGDTALVGDRGAWDAPPSAYVFEKPSGGWASVTMTETARLSPSEPEALDWGISVSIDGDLCLVSGFTVPSPYPGKVHVFQRPAGGWVDMTETAEITTSEQSTKFGSSLSSSGGTAFVGDWLDDGAAIHSGSVSTFDVPWAQEQKTIASDAALDDEFGFSVSVAENLALVGARYDDDAGTDAGAAYVLERQVSQWVELAKLTATDAAADDEFGSSVSVDGDLAVVGAPRADSQGANAGAAYVFERQGATWIEAKKLRAGDGEPGDQFGGSVSICGDGALVGARLDDDLGSSSGSVYFFERQGSAWNEVDKLTASDGAPDAKFGFSVSLFGDLALVGAPFDDAVGSDSGSAYVFRRLGSSWIEAAKLVASDGAPGDGFGTSVSIYGNFAVVGAPRADSFWANSGKAYLFELQGSMWIEVARLRASDEAAGDKLGRSVSVFGDTAVVGAWGDDDAGPSSGSAYVFERPAGGWVTETVKLRAIDADAGDQFGWSVAQSGDTILVGARRDDPAGSIYSFSAPSPCLEGPVPASISEPDYHFTISGASPNATLYLAHGLTPGSTPVGSCSAPGWAFADPLVGDPIAADADGNASFLESVPPSLVGVPVYYQALDASVLELTNVRVHVYE